MADKIFITKSKGGAGATTVVAGLGFALASAGDRTLIIDGDNLCGCGLAVCGCANMQVFTVADYERGACRAKQAMVQHPKYKNLYIMPTLGCTDKEATELAVREVAELFDFVLCDDVAQAVCRRTFVVTEPYLPSVRAADAKLCTLKDGGARIGGIIVNKVNGGLILGGKTSYPEEIAATLNAPLFALVPEDMALTLGQWRAYSMKYFKLAAARLKGKNVKLPYPESGYTGASGYFRRKMRERI